MSHYRFEVRRDNFARTRVESLESTAVKEGQVLLDIEQFALTANNVTYAVAGDMLGYWQFFPCDEGWGCIPVWAIGRVSQSAVAGIEVGQRYYGYFPMADSLLVEPTAVSERGFVDGTAHRSKLPVTYNQYMSMSESNGFPPGQDAQQLIYRPLFTTAFLIDDFLWDNNFFDATRIIIASASSKTAIATAFCLGQREGLQVTGLTSSANKAFVESLGLYSDVVIYDAIEDITQGEKTVYVDMSGNRGVLARIHHHLKDTLAYSCAVGITHYGDTEGEDPATLPGATPQMFFAPTQMEKRNAEWGRDEFFLRQGAAWQQFIPVAEKHINIVNSEGVEAVAACYENLLQGGSPDQAFVCRP